MGEKRSSLFNERVPNQKNFRVLKHQYFLGFFGRGDFFLRGWFPTLLSKKKEDTKEYIFITFALCALCSNEEEAILL